LNKKHYEITLCIEKERIESFIMDIRDASPDRKPKKDDWHMLIADSMEDQAKRQDKKLNSIGCDSGKVKESKPIIPILEKEKKSEQTFFYKYNLVTTKRQ